MNNFKKTLMLIGLYALASVFATQLYAQCGRAKKVPREFVTNRLSGDGNYYGHPYTIFNKKYEGFDLDAEIKYIRSEIYSEYKKGAKGPIITAYRDILTAADDSIPEEDNPDNTLDISKLAIWTKYNAFVLLIGLDGAGEDINRETYLNRVYDGFEHMNYAGAEEEGNVIVFANSVMCWIQAYDLYKTYMLSNVSFPNTNIMI